MATNHCDSSGFRPRKISGAKMVDCLGFDTLEPWRKTQEKSLGYWFLVTDRDTDRRTDRQTDRQTVRQTDRHTDSKAD